MNLQELPSTHREVRLLRRPRGLPSLEHFEIVETPLPVPKKHEVLIRNLFFRVSASVRMMVSEGAEDVQGVPFPALRAGDTLAEEAVGEVVAAAPDSGLSAGDLVLHFLGWREFAAVPVESCLRAEDILPSPAALLSHGWTAYAALTRGLKVKPGDTVFVSSAAGAVGSMAGQIARLLGAGRVIGSTSSHAKAERLMSELRYDAAVTRGAEPIISQLAAVAPDGIDIFFDNVGGEQLEAAVAVARPGARFVIIGALSGQLAKTGTGRTAPVKLDSFQILLKRVTVRGYSADDDPEVRSEWTRQFADWLRSGDIRFPHVMIAGIEQAPQALQDVTSGKYFGTVLVQL
jgi:NADPH-dependent curcumin reductase CurA